MSNLKDALIELLIFAGILILLGGIGAGVCYHILKEDEPSKTEPTEQKTAAEKQVTRPIETEWGSQQMEEDAPFGTTNEKPTEVTTKKKQAAATRKQAERATSSESESSYEEPEQSSDYWEEMRKHSPNDNYLIGFDEDVDDVHDMEIYTEDYQ